MQDIFNYTIVQLEGFHIKVSSLLNLLFFSIAVFIALQITKKIIYKAKKIQIAKKFDIYSLIKYFTLVFYSIFALQILGFNLSVLMAGSAALLVGLGLGVQNLFSDFISGIILLVDSTVKVNDVLDVNGLVCKVQEINLRTTTVLTRDDKHIILPNSDLTRNQLINWTHSNITSRFEISVGVDYASDIHMVMAILLEAANKQNDILKDPAPYVRFNDYGNSSLDFTLYFWAEEVFMVENIKSQTRIAIFELFKQKGITIPFPQRVVHIQENQRFNK